MAPGRDHCGQVMHRSRYGDWWYGDDETADCAENMRGHEVDGQPR